MFSVAHVESPKLISLLFIFPNFFTRIRETDEAMCTYIFSHNCTHVTVLIIRS